MPSIYSSLCPSFFPFFHLFIGASTHPFFSIDTKDGCYWPKSRHAMSTWPVSLSSPLKLLSLPWTPSLPFSRQALGWGARCAVQCEACLSRDKDQLSKCPPPLWCNQDSHQGFLSSAADALRGNPLRGTRESQSVEIAQDKEACEGSRPMETRGSALALPTLPQQCYRGVAFKHSTSERHCANGSSSFDA